MKKLLSRLLGTTRIPEGALTPLKTPTSPPAKSKLIPIDHPNDVPIPAEGHPDPNSGDIPIPGEKIYQSPELRRMIEKHGHRY